MHIKENSNGNEKHWKKEPHYKINTRSEKLDNKNVDKWKKE